MGILICKCCGKEARWCGEGPKSCSTGHQCDHIHCDHCGMHYSLESEAAIGAETAELARTLMASAYASEMTQPGAPTAPVLTATNGNVVAGMLERIARHDGDWLHANGETYRVLHIANQHADDAHREEYPLMVVYQGEDGRVWTKTPAEFLRSRREMVSCGCECGSEEVSLERDSKVQQHQHQMAGKLAERDIEIERLRAALRELTRQNPPETEPANVRRVLYGQAAREFALRVLQSNAETQVADVQGGGQGEDGRVWTKAPAEFLRSRTEKPLDRRIGGCRPEETGVGEWCAPGPAAQQERQWILWFEDQDRSVSVFATEQDGRDAFARAESHGWNCHLLAHVPRRVPHN